MLYPTSKLATAPMRKRSKSWALSFLMCAALLQGCGATLPSSPSASLTLPDPPSQSTPQPAQPYSKQWQLQVEDWQKVVQESRAKLKGTLLMRD